MHFLGINQGLGQCDWSTSMKARLSRLRVGGVGFGIWGLYPEEEQAKSSRQSLAIVQVEKQQSQPHSTPSSQPSQSRYHRRWPITLAETLIDTQEVHAGRLGRTPVRSTKLRSLRVLSSSRSSRDILLLCHSQA